MKTYNRPRVGAPPGLTVHWLISALAGEFTKSYKLSYNRKYHHYRFYRFRKRTLIDEFLVVRTSKRCYRVMYFNEDFKHFLYFSAKNYRECAERMRGIYNAIKLAEVAEKRHNKKAPARKKSEVNESLSRKADKNP